VVFIDFFAPSIIKHFFFLFATHSPVAFCPGISFSSPPGPSCYLIPSAFLVSPYSLGLPFPFFFRSAAREPGWACPPCFPAFLGGTPRTFCVLEAFGGLRFSLRKLQFPVPLSLRLIFLSFYQVFLVFFFLFSDKDRRVSSVFFVPEAPPLFLQPRLLSGFHPYR